MYCHNFQEKSPLCDYFSSHLTLSSDSSSTSAVPFTHGFAFVLSFYLESKLLGGQAVHLLPQSWLSPYLRAGG